MHAPLDELYLEWLYDQVGTVDGEFHWELLRQLYKKEFVWYIPNDDNRFEDGKELRSEFLEDLQIAPDDPEWRDLQCSFLEMMIGLARRLSFETERAPSFWFWHLMDNLQLSGLNDKKYKRTPHSWDIVEDILDRVIERNYNWNGNGGLFPLSNPDRDQRDVELWYQMQLYLMERE